MTPPPAPSTTDNKLRLIGLAFAGADLLFEVGPKGNVAYAIGAVEQLTGRSPTDLIGSNWTDMVGADDADLLVAILEGVRPGERRGPFRVRLPARSSDPAPRRASLSVFRLPDGGDQLSCALSLGGGANADDARLQDAPDDSQSFVDAAITIIDDAERSGLAVRLDLVEMEGLRAAMATMEPAEAEQTRRRIAATFRAGSYADAGASEIAPDRFALLRPAAASREGLAEDLQRAADGVVTPKTAQLPLGPAFIPHNLKAMRYALDRYIAAGPDAAASGFKAAVDRTIKEADLFKTMMADGAFQIVYQPVVDLTDGGLHHFEALARFNAQASPAATIHLAEELDLITDFDLAVARIVTKALSRSAKTVKIAVNMSAVSLTRPRFIDQVLAMTGSSDALRPRLLIELTETQTLCDLEAANVALQRLRSAGHPVCLDDFGAGAASLDYLRLLDVDFVKIDGRYVQALGGGGRDQLILKHVVGLCRDLGVATIAEMIETSAIADLARSLGVGLGQGWHFGKPTDEPIWKAPSRSAARRKGAVEQWG